MAKIIEYKVKLKLSRDLDGKIISDLQEESMTEVPGSIESFEVSQTMILQNAKSVSDFNQLQINIAMKSMFASEQSREVTIKQKRLVE